MSSPELHTAGRSPQQYCFADFILDLERGFLRRGGEEVPLRPKTFEVLAYLVKHHGRLVTKTALIEVVWPDTAITDNSLAQCLVDIRRALGDDSQQLIRTVKGRGYVFADPVTTHVSEFPHQTVASPVEPGPVIPSAFASRGALAVSALVIVASAAYFVQQPRTETTSLTNDVSFTQLTDQAGRETFPNLAGDGRSLVYAARSDGNWDIYFQRVGGKNPINLTKDCSPDDTQPAFSPDGEQIAFRSEREGGGIFVMGATGESARRLSDFGFNPAWSPDGKEIVFGTAGAWDPGARIALDSQLWVVNVSSGEKRILTKPGVVPDAVQPNWSPHRHRIAYWAVQGGQRDIWTVSADGTHPVAITQDAALDWSPVWSPDGGRLYFASDRAGTMNLWRVRIDEQSGRVLAGRRRSRLLPLTAARSASPATAGESHTHSSSAQRTSRKFASIPSRKASSRSRSGSPRVPGRLGILIFQRMASGWRSTMKGSRKTFSSLKRMERDSGSSPTMTSRTAIPGGPRTAGVLPFIPTAAASMTSG